MAKSMVICPKLEDLDLLPMQILLFYRNMSGVTVSEVTETKKLKPAHKYAPFTHSLSLKVSVTNRRGEVLSNTVQWFFDGCFKVWKSDEGHIAE